MSDLDKMREALEHAVTAAKEPADPRLVRLHLDTALAALDTIESELASLREAARAYCYRCHKMVGDNDAYCSDGPGHEFAEDVIADLHEENERLEKRVEELGYMWRSKNLYPITDLEAENARLRSRYQELREAASRVFQNPLDADAMLAMGTTLIKNA